MVKLGLQENSSQRRNVPSSLFKQTLIMTTLGYRRMRRIPFLHRAYPYRTRYRILLHSAVTKRRSSWANRTSIRSTAILRARPRLYCEVLSRWSFNLPNYLSRVHQWRNLRCRWSPRPETTPSRAYSNKPWRFPQSSSWWVEAASEWEAEMTPSRYPWPCIRISAASKL